MSQSILEANISFYVISINTYTSVISQSFMCKRVECLVCAAREQAGQFNGDHRKR